MTTRARYFQYQLRHHTLLTYKTIKQFGLDDGDKFTVCGNVETIHHLLYYSAYTKTPGNEIKQ